MLRLCFSDVMIMLFQVVTSVSVITLILLDTGKVFIVTSVSLALNYPHVSTANQVLYLTTNLSNILAMNFMYRLFVHVLYMCMYRLFVHVLYMCMYQLFVHVLYYRLGSPWQLSAVDTGLVMFLMLLI